MVYSILVHRKEYLISFIVAKKLGGMSNNKKEDGDPKLCNKSPLLNRTHHTDAFRPQ